MPTRGRTALVTGASAGIGRAFAVELARSGHDLVLTARRADRLERLARDLSSEFSVRATALAEDLADPSAPSRLAERIAAQGGQVDVLVNNAGYGVVGRFAEASWKTHADFIQVLVTSVAQLTHAFLPSMIERRHGRIVNVASVAAFLPSALGFTLYGAAKSFVVKMSESLAMEVAGTGVHVTALCPGFTRTEFHDVIGVRSNMDTLPRFMWMSAEEVARQGLEAVERGTPVYVNGAVYRILSGASRFVPRAVLTRSARAASRRMRGRP